MPSFYPYQQYVVRTWIRARVDNNDPQGGQAFEDTLRQLYDHYQKSGSAIAALAFFRLHINRVLAAPNAEISKRQAARYWFLGGEIANANRESDEALQYWGRAYRLVPDKQITSKIEAGRFFAAINLKLHRHLEARDLYREVMLMLARPRRLFFESGDRAGFAYYIRFWYAESLFGTRAFSECLAQLLLCQEFAHHWLVSQMPRRWRWQHFFYNQEDLLIFTPRDLFLPLLRKQESQAITTMLEQYYQILWLRSLAWFWQEKLKPNGSLADRVQSLTQLEKAHDALAATIAACERLSVLEPLLPSLYRQQAEIALLITSLELGDPKQQGWLSKARRAMLRAEENAIFRPEVDYDDQREQDKLIRGLFTLEKFRVAGEFDEAEIQRLRRQIAVLRRRARMHKSDHFEGRCCMLLAEIHAEIQGGSTAGGYDRSYLDRALAIFEDEGDSLRTAEIRLLMNNW